MLCKDKEGVDDRYIAGVRYMGESWIAWLNKVDINQSPPVRGSSGLLSIYSRVERGHSGNLRIIPKLRYRYVSEGFVWQSCEKGMWNPSQTGHYGTPGNWLRKSKNERDLCLEVLRYSYACLNKDFQTSQFGPRATNSIFLKVTWRPGLRHQPILGRVCHLFFFHLRYCPYRLSVWIKWLVFKRILSTTRRWWYRS